MGSGKRDVEEIKTSPTESRRGPRRRSRLPWRNRKRKREVEEKRAAAAAAAGFRRPSRQLPQRPSRQKKREALKALGIEYDFPSYVPPRWCFEGSREGRSR